MLGTPGPSSTNPSPDMTPPTYQVLVDNGPLSNTSTIHQLDGILKASGNQQQNQSIINSKAPAPFGVQQQSMSQQKTFNGSNAQLVVDQDLDEESCNYRECFLCLKPVEEDILYINNVGTQVAHGDCLRDLYDKLIDVFKAIEYFKQKIFKLALDNSQSSKSPALQTTIITGRVLEEGERSRPIAYIVHYPGGLAMHITIAIVIHQILQAANDQGSTVYCGVFDGGSYFKAAVKFFLTEEFTRCVVCVLKNELEKMSDLETVHPLKLSEALRAYIKTAVTNIGSGLTDCNLSKLVTALNGLLAKVNVKSLRGIFLENMLFIINGTVDRKVVSNEDRTKLRNFREFLVDQSIHFSDAIDLVIASLYKMECLSVTDHNLTFTDFTVVDIENVIHTTKDMSPYKTLENLKADNSNLLCAITDAMENQYKMFAENVMATNRDFLELHGVTLVSHKRNLHISQLIENLTFKF